MNFKKKFDLRVTLAKIDYCFTFYFLLYIVIEAIVNRVNPVIYQNHQFSLYVRLRPFWMMIPATLDAVFSHLGGKKICLDNSYLYLRYKGKEPSPTKDIPIKPEYIECYSLNNPFPAFRKWCNSSKNVTLFLKDGKIITLSAKDQELFFINWLKENFIRQESKNSRRGCIETAVFTAFTILEVLFFYNMYKFGNMPENGTQYMIASAICLAYWILYIISGLAIMQNNQIE